MTTRLKLLIITSACFILLLILSSFNYFTFLEKSENYQQQQKQNYHTQVESLVVNIFEEFKKASKTAIESARIQAAIESSNFDEILSLSQLTAGLPVDYAIYDTKSNTLYKNNSVPKPGEYFDIENLILSQLKSPGSRTSVGQFDKSQAVISSYGLKTGEEMTSILFVIMKMDQKFLDYISKLAGLKIGFQSQLQTLIIDQSLDTNQAKKVLIPFKNSNNASILYWLPDSISDNLGAALQSTVYILLIGIGLLLFVTTLFITKRQRDSLEALKSTLEKESSIDSLNDRLIDLEVSEEYMELVQKIRNVLTQQNTQVKQFQSQVKKSKLMLVAAKEESDLLKEQLDSAVSAPKTKSEFLSRMGDEITTPMKTLTSMLHLLSEYNLSDEPKELLTIARRASNTLINNLNNILDFSKLDAHLLKLHKTDFDIRQLIEEITTEYKAHASSKGLDFSAQVSEEVPEVAYNDPKRVRQILKNLIGNAIRFTKQGDVTLYVDLVVYENSHLLRLIVKDSGMGIPVDAQNGLFDSLDQRTKLTNSSFAGRLRLIVSKYLSELMGGKIGVESELEKGSRFWFTISMDK